MKKEAYYFSHDANAKDDPKILQLRMNLGWEGYGLFWGLIELLRNQPDYRMQKHYMSIAFALQTDQKKIESLVNDFDLFAADQEFFWSESLLKRMELKEEKSEKMRNAANKRWNKESDAKAMQKHSTSNAKAMQLKERKENETKVNERKENIFLSFVEIEEEMGKEKPLKRPYFRRMREVHDIDEKTVRDLFKKWAVLKEGEAMTIDKAQNSFNLYLQNNSKTLKGSTEKVEAPKYPKSTLQDNWW